ATSASARSGSAGAAPGSVSATIARYRAPMSRRAKSAAAPKRSSSLAARPCTVARMTPSASTSSAGAVATPGSGAPGARRPLRAPKDARRLGDRLLDRNPPAAHARFLGHRAVAEPGPPDSAGVPRFRDPVIGHHHGDVVAGTPAAETGDVLDGPVLGAHAT